MHRYRTIQPSAGAVWLALLMLLAGNACAQYAISQSPTTAQNPPTNVVVMMDDSGSMAWAYVPDGYGACTGTRRFNAGTFNALAYNPAIVYQSPTIITTAGAQVLKTSFSLTTGTKTGAWIDGFNTSGNGSGAIDLSTGYQPTASTTPGQTNQTFSEHPSQDLAAIFAPAAVPTGYTGGQPNGPNGNCGLAYTGNGNGSGGNQFGPASGQNTATGAAAYYYVYNASCSSAVVPPTNDDACYVYTRVTATSAPAGAKDVDGTPIDGFQNFANWYSFYRNRHLMIASAAAAGMADPVLQQARVTWRALNSCTDMISGTNCAGWDGVKVDNRLRTFTGTQQTNFYQWLTRIPASSPTPTQDTWTYIGDYFSAPSSTNSALGSTALGVNGPYGLNPNQPNTDPNSGEVACVQNFNITLTDGQFNFPKNGNSGAYFGKADATATTFPDGTAYTPSTSPPTAVYSNDSNSDVLSDIAFHYWATNLRPDISGSATAVPPHYAVTTGANGAPAPGVDYWNPQNDPATWPHVEQMTIGVGMTATMTVANLPWWGNNLSTQYSAPGYMNLWNGTVGWPKINNSAVQGDIGKAYDLWHAALNSRGLAFSAENAADLVTAIHNSLNRIKVTLTGSSAVATNSTRLSSGSQIYVASFTSSDWHGVLAAYGLTNGTINATPTWATTDPADFAAPGSRTVLTSTAGTPSSGSAQVNKGTTLSSQWTTIGGNSTVLSWLLGDATTEQRNSGPYRNRNTTILGDIIDSAPIFQWHENYGYAILPEGGSYVTFLASKGSGTTAGAVYVGANDGMLHGFDASNGKELFGYVPYDVIPNLPALASPAYAHQYYVDQTPYVGDACVGTGPTSCTWKTVLVGTTGAGGQGVFALDVTNPQSMGTGSVLWDLDGLGTGDTSGEPDLGYPIGKPVIARLNNGDWAAVFGNGYLSSRGCAVLFIVRLSDGFIRKIDTSGIASTSKCTATDIRASNGLGPVALSDVDGNMTADFAYAGDLQGHMYKFDLTNFSVALGGSPLFSASPSNCYTTTPNSCQPITSAPVLGPPLANMSGIMVYFGTGRLFAAGDPANTTMQSFYAVLDNNAAVAGPSALVQQTATDNGSTRNVTLNPIVAPGWFMNLPDTGERIIFSPVLLDGFVVFLTDIPGTSSICTASAGTGWIMAMPASPNAIGGYNLFFLDSPGANGERSQYGMPEGLTVISNGPNDKIIVGETAGQQVTSAKSTRITGRISWHELRQ